MTKSCKWCMHNPYAPHCDADGTCDFKTLPYEKDAILERLKQEVHAIEDIKKKLISADKQMLHHAGDEELQRIVDITRGMQIMVDRLQADFGMKESKIRLNIGTSNTGFVEKAKLLNRLRQMKKARGKRNGNKKSD